MTKRKAKAWESWEDEFVISRIKEGVSGKETAEQFVKEFPERGRSDSSVRSRYVVLTDRIRMAEIKASQPPSTQLAKVEAETVVPDPPPETGWRKVRSPKRWNPGSGEVLEGTYLGPRPAEGQYGAYIQYHVAEEDGRVWYVTGTIIEGLFTSAMAQPGMKVRVVFLGSKPCASGDGTYKDFDLFVKDGA